MHIHTHIHTRVHKHSQGKSLKNVIAICSGEVGTPASFVRMHTRIHILSQGKSLKDVIAICSGEVGTPASLVAVSAENGSRYQVDIVRSQVRKPSVQEISTEACSEYLHPCLSLCMSLRFLPSICSRYFSRSTQ